MGFSVTFNQSWVIRGSKTSGPSASPNSLYSPALKVKVYPIWFKQVSLDWTIPEEWGNCTFNVYVNSGPEEKWEKLTPQPIQNPRLTNPYSRETSKFREESYIVEALSDSGKTYRSAPTIAKTEMRSRISRISSEIQRREYLLLSKFTGIKSYVFRKKYYGERCPRCWSLSQEKAVDDHCPVCLGTTWKGGYFDPVPVFMQYEPTSNELAHTMSGVMEANQIPAWTISLPDIYTSDIVIRSGDWNLYSVVKVQTTELQTNSVRQMLTLTQLNRQDIEHKLLEREVVDDFGVYLETLGGAYSQRRFPRARIDGSPDNDPSWAVSGDATILPMKYTL